MDPIHVSLGELASALYLDTQTMPDTIIRNHIRSATKELVDRKVLHNRSQIESHVISFYRPYTFKVDSSVLDTVMSLANAAVHEDRQTVIDRNISKGLPADNTLSNLRDVYAQKRPMRDQFDSYIAGLKDDQVRDLVALMYSGRDGESFNDMRNYVDAWGREQCIFPLQKPSMPEYMKAGIERLTKKKEHS